MEELSTMIFNFFTNYGWQLGVCALGGIFLLGMLKMFGAFKWIKNADLKKFVYIFTSVILSMCACVIYLYCTNTFNWTTLLAIFIPVFTLNQAVYQLYETTGVRKVWKKLLNIIANGFGKLFNGVKNKMVESLGAEALRQIANKLDAEQKQPEQPVIKIE